MKANYSKKKPVKFEMQQKLTDDCQKYSGEIFLSVQIWSRFYRTGRRLSTFHIKQVTLLNGFRFQLLLLLEWWHICVHGFTSKGCFKLGEKIKVVFQWTLNWLWLVTFWTKFDCKIVEFFINYMYCITCIWKKGFFKQY